MLANAMARVRRPAVAGTFNPDDPGELSAVVSRLLESAPPRKPAKAIVAPPSSDLSHYLRYEDARRADEETARRIEKLVPAPGHPAPGVRAATPFV